MKSLQTRKQMVDGITFDTRDKSVDYCIINVILEQEHWFDSHYE